MNKILAAIGFYLLAILVTYGHAYNTRPDTWDYAGHTMQYGKGDKAVAAIAISIFWPLYVSTIVWEGVKK